MGSIDETVIKLIELGGKVVVPRTEVGDLGYPAVWLGTEGDKFGLGENKPGSEIRKILGKLFNVPESISFRCLGRMGIGCGFLGIPIGLFPMVKRPARCA